ncbi:exodeoxyribonuclease V subunit beta [Alteromonas sp. KUL49]|uniref:exodeoxyribonuclease V subunit beta n=1 Tax=Alteromonas sp. KUL49 TaxID=2480798 RepID=UPI00102F1EB3|nr:exodeoxyribonuclease V subunit beta [Alteromonas sp. KUL49]TAP37369.1 exodeoxyribonuclease V subunit beta [Alteromonas sp. KUL49]GEA13003.1 RecBCD enzyme subunit RecB [Alteromonas sp. KUL49]
MSSNNHLDVTLMPLQGRHLIEASAGTGKTYNITRIYLRLLLEKKLSVKEILVMTFTRAATEEIRSRIGETLREITPLWEQAVQQNGALPIDADPVFKQVFEASDTQEGLALLKAAQLELDEASVYTIHGFCQQVIAQLAFKSGFAMSLNLETDTSDLYLTAAEDWLRKLRNESDAFLTLAEHGWHVPQGLLDSFGSACRQSQMRKLMDEPTLEAEYEAAIARLTQSLANEFESTRQGLLNNEQAILSGVVFGHKDEQKRTQEWAAILEWLSLKSLTPLDKTATAFYHGGRYKGAAVKPLVPLFDDLKSLVAKIKKSVADLTARKQKALESLPALTLVNGGIDYIQQSVASQKQRLGIMDFDDLIRLLANEISKPDTSIVSALRQAYPVALIDEFQDTDADQYTILNTVYEKGSIDTALMMIGDPKQAIYRFRGGDIFTYLRAGNDADFRWVMNTNWRSVEGMVGAYNRLFYGTPLSETGTEVFGFGINYLPVESTPYAKAANTPLSDPESNRSAMNYVWLPANEDKPNAQTMQRQISQWIGNEIHRLFSKATLGEASIKPSDIAILVKNRNEASVIKAVLEEQGLTSVFLSDRNNLFTSSQARDLFSVLDGIWHLDDGRKVSASLVSPLWGISPRKLVSLLYHDDEGQWDEVMNVVSQMRVLWQQKGCMAVVLELLQQHYTPTSSQTERALTNYLHLAEVLEQAAIVHKRPEQLLVWLYRQINSPQADEEMTLRLESDNQLIRIVTQHGSKGLEYPIVFVPFASGYKDPAKVGNSYANVMSYYDESSQQLTLQLGYSECAVARLRAESHAEDTRLCYVAVTRAAHRCYMGVAEFKDNEQSALARALGVASSSDDGGWQNSLESIAKEPDAFSCCITVEPDGLTQEPIHVSSNLAEPQLPTLSLSKFAGKAEEAWRLYSFTALSKQTASNSTAHVVDQQARASESYPTTEDDIGSELADNEETALPLRFTLEKGANSGNLLHDSLEQLDFSQPNWAESCDPIALKYGVGDDQKPLLYEWLAQVLDSPLSKQDPELCLAALEHKQTLREAEFYFPMEHTQWGKLANLLIKHRKNGILGTDSVAVPTSYASNMEGMMHGFIDLIFEYEGKFYVSDYKSTWLGDALVDYDRLSVAKDLQSHLYDLQYLIYSLALHRYLAKRLPDYDPEIHFGGVYYLYLRGMHPENTQSEGVYFSKITTQELQQLSAIFSDASDTSTSNVSTKEGQV